MHKSYQPILPAANKLLQQRWDDKYYDEHRRLVYTAKPMVDTRAPQTYMHLYLKLKKLQLEEERLATIERDNRILLEKMSYIMRTRGRVDNRNDYESKSLNREKRQRELLRVTRENQEILRRISGRRPEYSHERWQEDWLKNLEYMDAISQYPKDWWLREDSSLSRTQQSSARNRSRQASSRAESKQGSQSGRRDSPQEKRSSPSPKQEDSEEQKANADAEQQETV